MLIFYFSSSLKSLYLLTLAECDSVGWGGAQAVCIDKSHPWYSDVGSLWIPDGETLIFVQLTNFKDEISETEKGKMTCLRFNDRDKDKE